MSPYDDPKPSNEKDNYYEEKSKEAIAKAIEETEGKTLDLVRFAVHRSYPFGALRTGRPYKIWRRLVLAWEAETGLAPRKHKKKSDCDYDRPRPH